MPTYSQTDMTNMSFDGKENEKYFRVNDVDLDYAGRGCKNTIFGEMVVAHELSEFNSMFAYPSDTRKLYTSTTNGGSVTSSNSLLVLSTGIETNGSALASSKRSLRYVAGHEGYGKFTLILTPNTINQRHYAGIIDSLNGFAIGMEGNKFAVYHKRNGNFESITTQENFNQDKLDGTGTSGYTIDVSKGNVFRISFGFLGFAPISFEVLVESRWIVFHIIRWANKNSIPHITLPYLKIQALTENLGNNTNTVIKLGSVEVGRVNGGQLAVSSRDFSISIDDFVISTSTNTRIAIFHNKATYGGIENRIEALLAMVTSNTDCTKSVSFKLYRLTSVPTGGTYTSISSNSTMEYSTDALISLTNADMLLPFNLAKIDSLQPLNVIEYNLRLLPDEYAVFVYSSTGAGTASLGIRWFELF